MKLITLGCRFQLLNDFNQLLNKKKIGKIQYIVAMRKLVVASQQKTQLSQRPLSCVN